MNPVAAARRTIVLDGARPGFGVAGRWRFNRWGELETFGFRGWVRVSDGRTSRYIRALDVYARRLGDRIIHFEVGQ